MHTVDIEGHVVHSLHAYFILGGDPSEPVRYEVDRLRNGRSFSTRGVVARQSGGAILNLSCSFQRPEEGPDVSSSVVPGNVRRPDELDRLDWGMAIDARMELESVDPPRSRMWARYTDPIGDDPTTSDDQDEGRRSRFRRFASRLIDRRELSADTKEILGSVIATSDKARTEAVKLVAREVRSYLDALELKETMQELVTSYSLEVSISLKPLASALQDEPAADTEDEPEPGACPKCGEHEWLAPDASRWSARRTCRSCERSHCSLCRTTCSSASRAAHVRTLAASAG